MILLRWERHAVPLRRLGIGMPLGADCLRCATTESKRTAEISRRTHEYFRWVPDLHWTICRVSKAMAAVRWNCMQRTKKQRERELAVMSTATVSRRMLVRANICSDEWWEIRMAPATGLSSNNTKRPPRRHTVTTINTSRSDKCYLQSIRLSHTLIRAKPTTDSPWTKISSKATSSEIR